jgi:hypothetical protein
MELSMMNRKTFVSVLFVLLLLSSGLLFFAGESCAASVQPGIYHIYGRVVNQEDKPVANCNVLLIKRKQSVTEEQQQEAAADEAEKKYEVTNEEVVTITDNSGSYKFVFEPMGADNFWVYFMAEGYATRGMEMNRLMRGRFFQKPNQSPILINVVLEKK